LCTQRHHDQRLRRADRYGWCGKGDLKAGASFRIQEAAKQPDGTYTTSRITVGRDGARLF
jgi:hypothetical protein